MKILGCKPLKLIKNIPNNLIYVSSINECMVEEKLVNHEIHLKQRPVGTPTENDFQLVKVDIPPRTFWISALGIVLMTADQVLSSDTFELVQN